MRAGHQRTRWHHQDRTLGAPVRNTRRSAAAYGCISRANRRFLLASMATVRSHRRRPGHRVSHRAASCTDWSRWRHQIQDFEIVGARQLDSRVTLFGQKRKRPREFAARRPLEGVTGNVTSRETRTGQYHAATVRSNPFTSPLPRNSAVTVEPCGRVCMSVNLRVMAGAL